MTVLAIDIGGTKLAAAVVDASLRLTHQREIPTPASKTPEALSAALEAVISPLKACAERVAIAATGVIHHGMLTAINPENLGGLAHFPLTETVSNLSGLPCLAVNDAQAAAWAEYHVRKDAVSEMVFLTVSTGVGGGVIINGQLQVGQGGRPGGPSRPYACGSRWPPLRLWPYRLRGSYRLRARYRGGGHRGACRARRQSNLC